MVEVQRIVALKYEAELTGPSANVGQGIKAE